MKLIMLLCLFVRHGVFPSILPETPQIAILSKPAFYWKKKEGLVRRAFVSQTVWFCSVTQYCVLESLLIISGIEKNPGPTSPQKQCAHCHVIFKSNTNPIQCINCFGRAHTNCKGRCPTSTITHTPMQTNGATKITPGETVSAKVEDSPLCNNDSTASLLNIGRELILTIRDNHVEIMSVMREISADQKKGVSG